MKELAHYSVDVRSLSPEKQSEIFQQLSGSCWTTDFTDCQDFLYWFYPQHTYTTGHSS